VEILRKFLQSFGNKALGTAQATGGNKYVDKNTHASHNQGHV